jgi:ribosomal protein S18 acetylase RimI-like enzyme
VNGAVTFSGYRPGVVAEVIGLHMAYYAPIWGFGAPFEAKLAYEMGEFLGRHDPDRDLFLAAFGDDGQLLGSITIDGVSADGEGAHLRWFIVAPSVQGRGLGKELMRQADGFLERRDYRHAYLTTFPGLDAARALYERYGFRLVAEEDADPWSGTVGLQRFERRVP